MILLVLLALLSIVAAVPFSFPCIPGIICGINAPSFGSYVGAKSDKLVVAHIIVGNTQPYSQVDWTEDILLAFAHGIDGFALNVGSDAWQPGQVALAFQAAAASGTGFKLFMSFDMTSLACAAPGDSQILQQYIVNYANNPNQLYYSGKVLVSTFGGENCQFGTGSVNDGWNLAVKGTSVAVTFIPAFFVNPSTFQNIPVMDGDFNWSGGWPQGDYDISFDGDDNSISYLGGKDYMAPVSPWFFTHYGPQSYNKNFIYRGDDWLYASRWEELITNRQKISLAQIITWNDYGESHYVGPIHGREPDSQQWTDGFDHTAWLNLTSFYVTAFKTGYYPAIERPTIWVWARPHPAYAVATSDPVGPPSNYQWTDDFLWCIVTTPVAGSITLSIGSSTSTTRLAAGISKVKLPLSPGTPKAVLTDVGGAVLAQYQGDVPWFADQTEFYNFNVRVGMS